MIANVRSPNIPPNARRCDLAARRRHGLILPSAARALADEGLVELPPETIAAVLKITHVALFALARWRGRQWAEWDAVIEQVRRMHDVQCILEKAADEVERATYAEHYSQIMERRAARRLANQPAHKQLEFLHARWKVGKPINARDPARATRILNNIRERELRGENGRDIAAKVAADEGCNPQYVRAIRKKRK